MHLKSDWLLTSEVSLVWLLAIWLFASASDALQNIKRKAYDWSASAARSDTDINQTVVSISQSPTQLPILNNSSNQLNALIIKAKTNLSADELKNARMRL